MRTLFVLRGAPGAGKSTLIRRHGLGDLAIGLDDFRRLYSTPFTDLDGRPTLSMAFGAEKQVVSAFKAAVATRIRQGGTLLLDCTNPTRKSYREFASLARRCGYAVHVIDIQGELSDAELIERNETRRGGIDYVGPEVVASIAARVRAGTASVVEPVVGLDDVRRLNTITEIDVAERYERLVVIGDVQSCAGALAKVKEHFGGWDPATLFVFVGDLFDRGPDAAGVLDLIADQADADGGLPDNIILVEGNHDEHLRMLCADVRGGSWPDTRESRRQILASGRRNGDIEALLARMVPMVGLRFAGEHILVTHAGLDPVTIDRIVTEREDGLLSWDLTEVPMLQLLLGSSERSTAFQGRSSYERAVELRLSHPRILQVHGHRNGTRSEEPGPALAAPNVYTLEHRVEHGGHLAVLQIDADGTRTLHAFEEDHPVLTGAAADPTSLVARMSAHPEVRVCEVTGMPGILACNFSRRAFTKGLWDETSCKARGLFLRADDAEVVARGYDKFFNLGQAPGPAGFEEVVRTGVGRPLTVRRKWNGYLGIVSVIDGRLRVLSKSGVTAYSEHAESLLRTHLGDRADELAGIIAEAGVSLTFEIISRRDPHIIDEGDDEVVLLDAIRNREDMELVDDLRLRLAEDFGFISPQVEVQSEAVEDAGDGADDALEALVARARAAEERGEEGFVITYADGAMTKYKSRVYSEIKAFRSLLTRHLAGNRVRVTGPGSALMHAYLEREAEEGAGKSLVERYTIDGLIGPVIDIPALVASL